MTKKEIEFYLKMLYDDDTPLGKQEETALFFRRFAFDGKDISSAVDGLIDYYKNANQMPVLEPAADAVITYWLGLDDIQSIVNFLDTVPFPEFVFDAMRRVVREGVDITSLLTFLVENFAAEQYTIAEMFQLYITQDPELTEERSEYLISLLKRLGAVYPIVPSLFKEASYLKLDMTPFFPLLVDLLKSEDEEVQQAAVSAFYWDITHNIIPKAVIHDILPLLEQLNGHQTLLAFSIGYELIRQNDWKQLISLQTSAILEIRQGIYRALIRMYSESTDHHARILNYLLEGLLDQEKQIRKLILAGLYEVEREEIEITPDSQGFDKLYTQLHLDLNRFNTTLVEYLLHIALKDNSISKSLQQFLSSLPQSSEENPTIKKLRKKLEQAASSNQKAVCTICKNIPRYKVYSFESDVPKEVAKFNFPSPQYGDHTEIKSCPECGRYYHYYIEQEWDDMMIDTTIMIRRMDPYELLQVLTGSELKEFKERLTELLVEYRQDLAHVSHFYKKEAAWALVRYYIGTKDWDELEKLLYSDKKTIKMTAVDTLASSTHIMDIPKMTEWLEDIYTQSPEKFGATVAHPLVRRYIQEENYDKLEQFLTSTNLHVVTISIGELRFAVRDDKFSILPIAEVIFQLTSSSNSNIRLYTNYTLEQSENIPSKQKLEWFIQLIDHEDVEIAEDALRTVGKLAEQTDISQYLDRIVPFLYNEKMEYYAIEAISEMIRSDKGNLQPIVSHLLKYLETAEDPRADKVLYLLRSLQEKNIDMENAYWIIARHICYEKGDYYTKGNFIEDGQKLGVDMSDIEPFIWNCLNNRKSLSDSFGDSLAGILAWIYYTSEDWEKMSKLLNHSRRQVAGPAMYKLHEEEVDLTPFVDDVIKNLTHSYEYNRSTAKILLEAWATRNTEFKLLLQNKLQDVTIPKSKNKELLQLQSSLTE